MEDLTFFSQNKCKKLMTPRKGETKFGEGLSFISSLKDLENADAQYVILGIPEDVGIRGNFGKPGASTTWDSFLSAFLNIQANQYNNPEDCVVLGHIDCNNAMREAARIMEEEQDPEKLGAVAERIDKVVSRWISKIVAMGKTPVIIGGGHNNSYGNIKGTSRGLHKPINILNIDAHTDLRRTDYRHSGNGFSFAKEEGFMANYAMFGIHKNYTPQYIFDKYGNEDSISLTLFEELLPLSTHEKLNAFKKHCRFLDHSFGLEIDCDAIAQFSSSAMTPIGFSLCDIHNFIGIAKKHRPHYMHLCEAAAKGNAQIGKALSYLVAHFIRKD